MTRRTAADGGDDDESTTKPRKPAVVRSSKRARRAPKAVYDNDFEAHEIQNVRLVSSSSLFLSLSRPRRRRACLWRFVITTKRLTTTTSLSSSRRFCARANDDDARFLNIMGRLVLQQQQQTTGNQSVESPGARSNGREQNPTRADFLPDRRGIRRPDCIRPLDSIQSRTVRDL